MYKLTKSRPTFSLLQWVLLHCAPMWYCLSMSFYPVLMIVSFHFSDDLSRCFNYYILYLFYLFQQYLRFLTSWFPVVLCLVTEDKWPWNPHCFSWWFLYMLLDDIAITHLPSDSLGGIYVFVMYVYINPTMPGMKKKIEIRVTRVKVEYAVCAYACTVACFLSIFRPLCLLSFACLPAHENI